jgi:L-threonylcarbamoyladenylate synthase
MAHDTLPKKNTVVLKNILGDPRELEFAAEILRSGGLVVFPTETVYGLGANALDADAVRSIFAAKGRPPDNPLIAHVADISQVGGLAESVGEIASLLFARFSPGPLTVVLPKRAAVPDCVSGGLPSVGVRIPAHPVARALIAAAGVAVVAPSANISGKPSPTGFEMALAGMNGLVDAVIDGGDCEVGLESTVVAVAAKSVRVLRPGAVTLEMLREALRGVPGVEVSEASHAETLRPESPGMKYAHYKPKADVYVTNRVDPDALESAFPGMRLGFIRLSGDSAAPSGVVRALGETGHLCLRVESSAEYARLLYRTFHEMDDLGVQVIVAQAVEESGIGKAVMNRLRKASAGKIV